MSYYCNYYSPSSSKSNHNSGSDSNYYSYSDSFEKNNDIRNKSIKRNEKIRKNKEMQELSEIKTKIHTKFIEKQSDAARNAYLRGDDHYYVKNVSNNDYKYKDYIKKELEKYAKIRNNDFIKINDPYICAYT